MRTLDGMCRNIRTLYNFEPSATEDEVRAAALQYVRKISGFNKPSQANAAAFERAVDAVGAAEGPRGRGGQGARPLPAALRGLNPQHGPGPCRQERPYPGR